MLDKKNIIEFVNNKDLELEGEVWKQHPVYTSFYASNFGRIKDTDRKGNYFIKTQLLDERNGCNRFRFNSEKKYLGKKMNFGTARFVMECFYGINKEMFVDHINSIPYDNRIENLRYVDRKTNNNNPNSRKKQTYSKTKNCFVRIKQIDIITNNVIKIWEKAKTIEKELNLPKNCHKNILTVCNGRQKTAYGYKWEYDIDKDLEGEVWKKHPLLELECSNKGRVRWLKINKTYYTTYGGKHTCGYLMVEYKKRKYLVHRLIAETFLSNEQKKPFVNHIDCNVFNNCVENLEWCTPSENMLNENTRKKTSFRICSVDVNGNIIKKYNSTKEAEKTDGYHSGEICKCLKDKSKVHKGLRWYFQDEYYEELKTNGFIELKPHIKSKMEKN